MSGYKQYAGARKSWGINALGGLVVEVEAEDGTTGVGITIGGEPGCYIVEHHLSRFVEGCDPRDVELMWDQMWRSTINYGRKGLPIQCISAIDLAIWDLLGHLRNEPVYALLGGKVVDRLPCYMTSSNPLNAKNMGFVGGKCPCPYGPSAGDEGLRKNVEFFAGWREKVGPDFPLMLDCYMALTVPYAIKLGKALQPYNIKWMEEFLPPDDYAGYARVKEALKDTGIMLTTGEHEYTRYGFRMLIESKCADILQPDITWLGGMTEARRVVAMASAHDILVIPHGVPPNPVPRARLVALTLAFSLQALRFTLTTCNTPSPTAPSPSSSTSPRSRTASSLTSAGSTQTNPCRRAALSTFPTVRGSASP